MSFPPDHKACMYCGGPLDTPEMGALQQAVLSSTGGVPPADAITSPADGPQAPDEEQSRPRGFRRGLNGIWIVLVLAGMLGRACTGG